MKFLQLKGVSKQFGGLMAIDNLDMEIKKGEIRGLIGPNGSGKTTTFNVIYGSIGPTFGEIVFEGKEITGRPPNKIAELGITRTFQQISLFKTMNVLDTVKVGAHLSKNCSFNSALLRTRRFHKQEHEIENRAMEALEIVGLRGMESRLSTELAYGQQRLVEIARALAIKPRLLLLDEPVAGMNPTEIDGISNLIQRIRDMGITILLVEHNMGLVMEISDRVTVLSHGKKIAEGVPKEIQNDPVVIENYLGRGIGIA